MSVKVTYKGNTLTNFSNTSKKLLTAGKYLEDDVTISDDTGLPVGTARSSYIFTNIGLTWVTNAEEN